MCLWRERTTHQRSKLDSTTIRKLEGPPLLFFDDDDGGKEKTTTASAARADNLQARAPHAAGRRIEPRGREAIAENLQVGLRMRESGLVVTGSRVTVEARTTCPSWWTPSSITGTPPPPNQPETSAEAREDEDGGTRKDGCAIALSPGEDYLMALSDVANERMVRNGVLIDRLLRTLREGLFPKVGWGGVEEGGGRRSAADGLLRPPPRLRIQGDAAPRPPASEPVEDRRRRRAAGREEEDHAPPSQQYPPKKRLSTNQFAGAPSSRNSDMLAPGASK